MSAHYNDDGIDQPESMSQDYFRGWRRSEKLTIAPVILVALISAPYFFGLLSLLEVAVFALLMMRNEDERLYRHIFLKLVKRTGIAWENLKPGARNG